MKIGLVVPGGFGSGSESCAIPALSALVGELAARHEVHVFAFASPVTVAHHSHHGAQVHHVEYPWLGSEAGVAAHGVAVGRLAWQLRREILRASGPRSFQVLHAFWANEPGLLAGLLGRTLDVPVVLSVGGGEAVWIPELQYGGGGTLIGRALGALAFGLADEITAGTAFARSFLPKTVAERARVIPLGISCGRFDSAPPRSAGPPWRLLHVASLNRIKDQRTLLAAFAEVVARLKDVSLDCVGADTLGGEMQLQARTLGIAEQIHFHGFLAEERLVPLYRDAHLLVQSSRYESQGVVVLEAAAAGLPTVGTAVGILPTMAPDGAHCVEPGQPKALADAICALLIDRLGREAMGAKAQEFARSHDAAWTARSFEEIYSRLVDGRRRAAARGQMDPVRAYDLWSTTYDEQVDNPLLFLDEDLLATLLPSVPLEGKVIADVGCGTGRHWKRLLADNPARLIGYDVSSGMLARLAEKFSRTEARKINGYHLADTPDASCDVLISTLTLGYLADLDAALAEWSRVLRTGGDVIITDFHPDLAAEGDRSFLYRGKTMTIRHHIHSVTSLRASAASHGLEAQRFEERAVDASLNRFYANDPALFERIRGRHLMYGIHLRKTGPQDPHLRHL